MKLLQQLVANLEDAMAVSESTVEELVKHGTELEGTPPGSVISHRTKKGFRWEMSSRRRFATPCPIPWTRLQPVPRTTRAPVRVRRFVPNGVLGAKPNITSRFA